MSRGPELSASIREVAAALRREGVHACFGVTGSGPSWQLIAALEDAGAAYHPVAHEAAGAIMAGAFARQSRSLGCSISIKGPGLANMVAGMLSNRYENWSALSISEAYSPAEASGRMHKRLDQRALTGPIAKAFASSTSPSIVPTLASIARAEIPGPVHLDFAGSGTEVAQYARPMDAPTDATAEWEEILRRIDRANRPVVIAGSLATRSPWGGRLSGLSLPVLTTVAAKGVLDETTPYAGGIFTGDGKSLAPETAILRDADLIVGLGLRSLEVLTPRPFKAPLVVLDVSGEPALVSAYEPVANFLAAGAEEFYRVLDALASKPAWGTDLTAASVDRIRSTLTAEQWLPGPVLDALQRLLTEDAQLVTDTGSFCTVAEHVWRARSWIHFVASANGRFMGTGVPMAIGASLAGPSSPVICAVGDGGIRPFLAEIKMAIRYGLSVLFVLMSDGRYGSVAAAAPPGLTRVAVDIPDASWFQAVASLGCPSCRVDSLDGFLAAAAAWRPAAGPSFVEAVFPPDAYAAMTTEIR